MKTRRVPHFSRVLGARSGNFLNLIALATLLILASCSPRDFLTRRLATDLISSSDAFKAPQQFVLQTGVVSNKDYASPEYLVLQHHGWISATTAPCPPGLPPPPCWDVLLTPIGVDTVRALIPAEEADKPSLAIPVARRDLVASPASANRAVWPTSSFTWKWVPLNEVGAALYSGDLRYNSTVGFRDYDDGWRIVIAPALPAPSSHSTTPSKTPSPRRDAGMG
jgi:hypothetical protein